MNYLLLFVRAALLVAIACIGSAQADGLRPPDIVKLTSKPSCLSAKKTAEEAVVLIFDRTTVLDPTSQERWKVGVKGILENPVNDGKFYVLEIRDTPNGLRMLGQGCLADYRGNSTTVSWMPGWIREALPKRVKSDEEHQFMLEANIWRNDYARQLIKLGSQDWATKDSSEIAVALMSATTTYCGGKKVCRLFVFSDMQDTRAKQSIVSDLSKSEAAGRRRALEVLEEFHPQLRETDFYYTVWGYGRDEQDSSKSAPDHVRKGLKRFWGGYFKRLMEEARPGKGGGEIHDHFPDGAK